MKDRPRGTGRAKLSVGLGAESQCKFHPSPLLSPKRGACAREAPVHTMLADVVPGPTVSRGHDCSPPSASSDSDVAPVSGRSCPARARDALQRPHSTVACPPPGKAHREHEPSCSKADLNSDSPWFMVLWGARPLFTPTVSFLPYRPCERQGWGSRNSTVFWSQTLRL